MRIVDSGPVIDVSDVEALETELGVALPAGYRAFMTSYNGGRPEPCGFQVPAHAEGAFDIQLLFGLSRSIESSNLKWNVREYPLEMREDCLPIGCTDTNDLVLLGLKGIRRGQVLFQDLMAIDKPLYEVSPSFEEFLESLGNG